MAKPQHQRPRTIARREAREKARVTALSKGRLWVALLPALAFLFVGIALLVVAWLQYPQMATPTRAAPLTVSVGADRPVSGVILTVEDPGAAKKVVQVDVIVSSSVSTGDDANDENGTVNIAIPDALITPGTNGVQCSPECESANEFLTGATPLRTHFRFRAPWKATGDGSQFTSTLTLDLEQLTREVDDVADELAIPGMNCSALACRGSVPLVVAESGTTLGREASAQVHLRYPGLQAYEWEAAITPYPGVDAVGLGFSYPLGVEPSEGLLPRYDASGSNRDAESDFQFRLFLSGALVGIAGGFLLACAQEAIAAVRSHRRH